MKPGDVAGNLNKDGYWQVTITTDKKRKYLNHRIIYYMQTGSEPGSNIIDHANGKKDNTSGLRLASYKLNSAYRSKPTHRKGRKTTSNYKGVYWNRLGKKWRAYITVDGKSINLGYFASEKEAARAYNKAALEAWGEYALLNEIDKQ